MATLPEFRNEPFIDFSREDTRTAQVAAIDEVMRRGARDVPLVIGGERRTTGATFTSTNPALPAQVLATVQKAGPAEVKAAMGAAACAFQAWRWVPARERAVLLLRVAAALRKRRGAFNALLTLEAGKTFVEADVEFAECVDFLEYYARDAMRLNQPQPVVPFAGELNELRYIPLGVGIVIPPWNFPLAIMAGMTMAAVVTGNTVVLKPSSDTPLCAWAFFEVLEQCGMPPGVVNFLPGPGAVVGDGLVADPHTRFVSFTGSRDVGIHINEVAARVGPGQLWLKRVVAEMGGKDFMIVDESADLDEAAAAVAAAAFGYQGQKCSACSRAIVHDKVYDAFVKRLIPHVEAIKVGAPREPGNGMGPVINEAAWKSINGYIEAGKKDLKLLHGGGRAGEPGWFIQPTVFGDVPETHRVACEEIFGPVLAVTRARDFDHAVTIANATDYGLTGAIYTLDRGRVARARRLLHCGNLYINRKCTGAMVGVHPFGGFNMSGTDSKAGGRDYLLLYTQAKSISEKLG